MIKWFKEYISTFKFTFDFWSTFLVDYIFFAGFYFIFTWFSDYVNGQSKVLLGGKTVEQIQQSFTPENAQQSLAFLSQLHSFLWIFVIGLVLLVLGGFVLFGLEQAVIWYHFERKKVSWRTYWKWNVFNIVLIIPLVLYGVFYLLVTLVFGSIFGWIAGLSPTLYFKAPSIFQEVVKFLNSVVSFSLGIWLLLLLFVMWQAFANKYTVWASIGEGFSLFWVKRKKLVRVFCFALPTAVLFTLVAIPIRMLFASVATLSMAFDLFVLFFFIGWLRLVVVGMLRE